MIRSGITPPDPSHELEAESYDSEEDMENETWTQNNLYYNQEEVSYIIRVPNHQDEIDNETYENTREAKNISCRPLTGYEHRDETFAINNSRFNENAEEVLLPYRLLNLQDERSTGHMNRFYCRPLTGHDPRDETLATNNSHFNENAEEVLPPDRLLNLQDERSTGHMNRVYSRPLTGHDPRDEQQVWVYKLFRYITKKRNILPKHGKRWNKMKAWWRRRTRNIFK